MTPEEKRWKDEFIEALLADGRTNQVTPPRPRPQLVCDHGVVVGRAVVVVGPKDPNWWKGPQAIYRDGVVVVGGGSGCE
jgi:hypothetical protein